MGKLKHASKRCILHLQQGCNCIQFILSLPTAAIHPASYFRGSKNGRATNSFSTNLFQLQNGAAEYSKQEGASANQEQRPPSTTGSAHIKSNMNTCISSCSSQQRNSLTTNPGTA
ncbi:hypothetical protein Nepgr_022987 [Nepenthes gracilis]|uniref:Uncharacterized protein n=1 Tax=Nepenthes gracilis TaxID=150966 RepID=A0AAD3T1M4_NEPGR|nr:hypothetical protein Nepgr_022987 [Nepenthes gracilis]